VGVPTVSSADEVLEQLRVLGCRMTPQRRAIVAEIMASDGHISPAGIAQRVSDQIPGVNASTVYRTLYLLEDVGVLSHVHLEAGPEYQFQSEAPHVHLTCAACGFEDSMPLEELLRVRDLVVAARDFAPDLTHFAISGTCSSCRKANSRPRKRQSDPPVRC